MQDCMQILNEFLGNNLSTERKKNTLLGNTNSVDMRVVKQRNVNAY